MCKFLLAYGIPWKIGSSINNMYKTTTAKVIPPNGETDTFEMAIPDDRAHEPGFTIKPRRNGKQNITNLGFVDDLALL